MTHWPIQTLPDGTRKYSNHTKYTPLPPEKRKNKIRKPDDPRAVRIGGTWYLPLDLLHESLRMMPETRPDTDAYDHMGYGRKCRCDPCQRPQAIEWQTKWWKDHGVRFVAKRPRR